MAALAPVTGPISRRSPTRLIAAVFAFSYFYLADATRRDVGLKVNSVRFSDHVGRIRARGTFTRTRNLVRMSETLDQFWPSLCRGSSSHRLQLDLYTLYFSSYLKSIAVSELRRNAGTYFVLFR